MPQHGFGEAVRIGDHTPRGYERADFLDAWGRYLPPPSAQSAKHPQQAKRLFRLLRLRCDWSCNMIVRDKNQEQ